MCTSWPFFATPGTSAGMGPLISAWITTVFPSAAISSITLTRKFGMAFGNARQITSMPRRIGTTLSRPYVLVRHLRKERACHQRRGHRRQRRTVGQAIRSLSHSFSSLCSLVVAFVGDLCGLVFKPLAERFDLFLRIRREQVLDGHVGRRNENRFRMREGVKPGLAVVVTNPGISDSAKGHGFDK